MRLLIVTAALALAPTVLESVPKEPAPQDLEKARRLLEVEMRSIHSSLVAYRTEHIVGRTGAERQASDRTWWSSRRSHAQIAGDLADPVLDLESAARLLDRARELEGDLQALRRMELPKASVAVAAAMALNDDCPNAQPVGEGTFFADTTAATQDGHSSCDFNVTTDVWYAYTTSASGNVVFQTVGSDYDTVLSLHPSCPGIANELTCNDDDHPLTSSRVTRSMNAGETVLVRVAGDNGSSGSLVLDIAFAGAIAGTLVESGTADLIAFHPVRLWKDGDLVETTSADPAGHYTFDGVPAGSYTVEARGHVPYLGELYDDIDCFDFDCDETTGTVVVVAAGATTSGIDFALDIGGSIQGTVTAELGGAPIEHAFVDVFDTEGRWRTSGHTDATGDYITESALPAGAYTAVTSGRNRFFGELYDEIPCPDFCDETLGTPIAVNENMRTGGIDFTLLESGAISGIVTDAVTGFPLSAGIGIYDSAGSLIAPAVASNAGTYITDAALPAGQYRAIAESVLNYLDEIYSGIHCGIACDPTVGMPIAVSDGVITAGIDFNLVRSASIMGVVTDTQTGQSLENAHFDLFAAGGSFVGSSHTDGTGTFFVSDAIEPGTYYASASASGYFDEAYDDVPCESPSCALSFGTPIAVSVSELRTGIDFALDKPTATCAARQDLILTGTLLFGSHEAYSSINATDATFQGAVTLRARDVVSFGNGTTVVNGSSLVVELDPFAGCPATLQFDNRRE